MAEIDENRAVRMFREIRTGEYVFQLKPHGGNSCSVVEDAVVADHDEPGSGCDIVECEKPGGQFRTDAGRIRPWQLR
jgi:hypothetical protein